MTTSSSRGQATSPAGAAGPSGAGDAGKASTAQVMTRPAASISGTAHRSARRTAPGPRATTVADTRPSPMAQARSPNGSGTSRAHTDAAMTLFTAIHAKLVTKSTAATTPAPVCPSTARAAIIDGTPRRDPIGASAATRPAPAAAPTATTPAMVALEATPPSAAPTCRVVATMLAAAKTRNRSQPDCVCAAAATGVRSAARTAASAYTT